MKKVELVTALDLERLLLDCLRNNELPDSILHGDQAGLQNYITFYRQYLHPMTFQTLGRRLSFFKEFLPRPLNLVCIGIGNGIEEQHILEEFKDKINQTYFIDVSSTLLEMVLNRVADVEIDSTAIVSFFEDLQVLSVYWYSPVLYCLMGNRFCSYEGETLLERVGEIFTENDFFLFNCLIFEPNPQKQSTFEIDNGYKSTEHVQFNAAPLLSHGAGINDFQFHLDLLLSGSIAGPVYRTRKSINFLRSTQVNCTCGNVQFQAGERLSMGSIYKYSIKQVRNILEVCGFSIIAESLHGTDLMVLCKRQTK
jgi:hypothetical protein